MQLCYWVGFRISLSLSREGAIFRDEIQNFSCSHLARRDRDYHMTILVFRDKNEITLLFSCFETRSRLQKIISRGRARKNEADSRREFPGSRILADLCLETPRTQLAAQNSHRVIFRPIFSLFLLFLSIPKIGARGQKWSAATKMIYMTHLTKIDPFSLVLRCQDTFGQRLTGQVEICRNGLSAHIR